MNRRSNRLGGSVAGNPARETPELAVGLQALTAREVEVLRLLSTGASARMIADRLEIKLPTVKRHLLNTYRKLGVTNRVQAARCYLVAELNPSAAEPSERQRPDRWR
jgi:DNA-binding NarL/FixJ family response regulator